MASAARLQTAVVAVVFAPAVVAVVFAPAAVAVAFAPAVAEAEAEVAAGWALAFPLPAAQGFPYQSHH